MRSRKDLATRPNCIRSMGASVFEGTLMELFPVFFIRVSHLLLGTINLIFKTEAVELICLYKT